MARPRGTTQSAASAFTRYSKQGSASRSTKTPKPSRGMAVFGTSSQFKGIGRGRRGDPRK